MKAQSRSDLAFRGILVVRYFGNSVIAVAKKYVIGTFNALVCVCVCVCCFVVLRPR